MTLNLRQLWIRTAINEWLYAHLLLDAVQTGRITPATFPREFEIRTVDREGNQIGEVLGFVPPFTAESMLDYHENLTRSACASAATKITAVLEGQYGARPSNVHDPVAKAAFTIIKLSRHAWAHIPQGPHWKVPVGDRKRWKIDRIGLTVDLTDADGRPIDGRDYGGWAGFYRLMVLCEDLVAT